PRLLSLARARPRRVRKLARQHRVGSAVPGIPPRGSAGRARSGANRLARTRSVARNLQRRRTLSVEQEAGAQDTEEFMSVAAHDLRNPIAVVRASAQMAQRQIGRGDANGAQTRLKSIVDQTDRLTEILESFLDAARIGAGNLPLRTEQVDLRAVT